MNNHFDDVEKLLELAGPPRASDSAQFQRVKNEVFQTWQATQRKRRRTRYATLAAAMMAAIFAGAVFLVFSLRNAPTDPQVEVQTAIGPVFGWQTRFPSQREAMGAGNTLRKAMVLETEAAGKASLLLDPGVSIRVAKQTRLSYLGGATWMLHSGKIYVTTDGASISVKLEIQTPHGKLHNMGTRFEVEVTAKGTDVRVRQGNVRLQSKTGQELIAPGQALRLDADGQWHREDIEIYGPSWNWILDIGLGFETDGQTLEKFLVWVEAETGRAMHFSPPELEEKVAAVQLSGILKDLNAYQALAAVLPACGLQYSLKPAQILIQETATLPRGTRP